MTKVYWAELPLQKEAQRINCMINDLYGYALSKNLTNDFFGELKIRARSNQNLIFSSFGLQGGGKTYQITDIVMEYLSYFQPPKKLNIDNCSFTVTDMLKRIGEAEKGETFILDEQVHTSGYGSSVERKALNNIETTVRADKLSLFFAAPSLIRHNFHYYVEVWQMGSLKPWDFNQPITDQWRYTKSILFSHKAHPLGYIITTTPRDKEFLEKYEAKKARFIQNIKEMKSDRRAYMLLEWAKKVLEDKEFISNYIKFKSKDMRKLMISNYLGKKMSIDELKQVVAYIDYYSEAGKKPKEPKTI